MVFELNDMTRWVSRPCFMFLYHNISTATVFLLLLLIPQLLVLLVVTIMEACSRWVVAMVEESRLYVLRDTSGISTPSRRRLDTIHGRLSTRRFCSYCSSRADEETEKICPICLTDFEPTTRISCGPCGHRFCTQCIVHWLERHTICPFCRATILPRTSSSSSSDQPPDESNDMLYYPVFAWPLSFQD
mmetsp:Transcript_16839/g.24974  ORF Transcript_16839/g.24974 Transcript_16839/m.24974 type:complete len:188 (-) Transcript_16839:51-614(-)